MMKAGYLWYALVPQDHTHTAPAARDAVWHPAQSENTPPGAAVPHQLKTADTIRRFVKPTLTVWVFYLGL